MRELYGKQVFDSLEELVAPEHTAIIVVDMQNDLVSTEGFLALKGDDVSPNRSIIQPLHNLLAVGRKVGVKVVAYIQYTIDPTMSTVSSEWIYRSHRKRPIEGVRSHYVSLDGCMEGTWGWEIIPELEPQEGDIRIRKNHLGAFWATNMDKILRDNGIKTVVVTGTATSGCVHDTAVGASANDYYTVVVKDCVIQNNLEKHDLGLRFLAERYDTPNAEDVVTAWAESPAI